MTTLLVYAPALAHTFPRHPESHERVLNLMPILEEAGVLGELTAVSPTLAPLEHIQRVHSLRLIEHIRHTAVRGGGFLDGGDTYVTGESYQLAKMAVGACTTAVDHILTNKADNGLAIVRPPGHHAEYDRVSGFCLFNNVAAAARHAQAKHGLERVMIVDFDVHHGNGTQDIFYDDPSVLFVSTHLLGPYFYPGTGHVHEMGQGSGQGHTLNVPLPTYVGDMGYDALFHQVIYQKALEFNPQMILVSIGFDAHWQDPLASAGLSLKGYAHLSRTLISWARELCGGKILFVLEGGYKHDVLHYGVLNLSYALLGKDQIIDPIGTMSQAEQSVKNLVRQLKDKHLLI